MFFSKWSFILSLSYLLSHSLICTHRCRTSSANRWIVDFRDNEGLYLTNWQFDELPRAILSYLRAPLSKFASISYLNERKLVIKPDVNEGLRSSHAKVISPEVMSPAEPESCWPKFIVISPEILSHVARNFIERLNLKKSNILSKSLGINSLNVDSWHSGCSFRCRLISRR